MALATDLQRDAHLFIDSAPFESQLSAMGHILSAYIDEGSATDVYILSMMRRERQLREAFSEQVIERSSIRSMVDTSPHPPFGVTPSRVASIGDLTGMGIEISEWLDSYATGSPIVVLDGVATMTMYRDSETLFRFVHYLTQFCKQHDATLVVRADTDIADLTAVKSLFDEYVELREREDCEAGEYRVVGQETWRSVYPPTPPEPVF